MKAGTLITIGVAAGIGYALYRWIDSIGGFVKKAGSTAAAAVEETGGAIGRTIYDLFHPSQVGESLYYTVDFPDLGGRHSVASGNVDASGRFLYGARYYQMLQGSDGSKRAQLLSKPENYAVRMPDRSVREIPSGQIAYGGAFALGSTTYTLQPSSDGSFYWAVPSAS